MLSSFFWPVELGLCLPLILLLVICQQMDRWMRSAEFRSLYPGCRSALLRLVYNGLVVVATGNLLAFMLLALLDQPGWSLPASWPTPTTPEVGGVLLASLLHLACSRLGRLPRSHPRPPRVHQTQRPHTWERKKPDGR